MRRRSETLGLLLITSFVLACGGEGDGSARKLTGRFIDSPVEGLTYTSGDPQSADEQSGVTDKDGSFDFTEGQPIEFKLGDILLGKASKASSVLTPVELVSGAKDEMHDTVTNIARFLQSLDTDANLDNGIKIFAEASALAQGKTINFAQTPQAFGADPAVLDFLNSLPGSPSLQSPGAAQQHLNKGLLDLISGSWEGTFSGGESGTWQVAITAAAGKGIIEGGGTSNQNGPFGATGTTFASGAADFTVGTAGAGSVTFAGSFRKDGTAEGTWSYVGGGGGGTWRGKRTSTTPAPTPKSQDLLVERRSPNKCVLETLSNSVSCAKCAGLPTFFTVLPEHGSGFKLSFRTNTTYDSVDNGGGTIKLKADVLQNLVSIATLQLTCSSDGSVCKQTANSALSLPPGNYALAAESFYCDGTGGTKAGTIATIAVLSN
jgi:hypothetical protein